MKLFPKKNNLKAVYDDDLIGYLKSVGLYDGIIGGTHLCIYCGNKITIENLEIMVPNGNTVDFVCNNKKCLNQL